MPRRAALVGGTVAVVMGGRKCAAIIAGPLPQLVLIKPPAPPPAFTFQDESGATHKLADYPGYAFVVNLWATWCAPCTAELPSLDRLAGKVADQHIKVLALSSDHGGVPVVRKFYEQHGIKNLAVLLDPQGQAMQAFRARGVPTTYIIDAHGLTQAYAEGGEDWGTDAAVKRVTELASA